MKAGIYNPYWDTLGGGERYTASFISLLLKKGYRVDIEWNQKDLKTKIKNRFDIDISGANIVESIERGDSYDLCFWISDGSIPTLRSRNNILHFQYPFKNVNGKTLMNRMKLFRIKNIVCNSKFTKSYIDKEFGVDSKVVYPPVDVLKIKSGKKENLILYVGRFSQLTQSKNQHILVEVFKKLYDKGNKGWKLILAGGSEIGLEKTYLEELKVASKGYPISIVLSPSDKKLKEIYFKAKIFWSASGFEVMDPLKAEHFGMTVVEAMAAKAVPIIVQKGGHVEIIESNISGYFWEEKSELLGLTESLISDKDKLSKMSNDAFLRSAIFSRENFEKEFEKIL